jgi:hypothetical protein
MMITNEPLKPDMRKFLCGCIIRTHSVETTCFNGDGDGMKLLHYTWKLNVVTLCTSINYTLLTLVNMVYWSAGRTTR